MLLLLFLKYWLIFSNSWRTAQIFNPNSELIIPIGIPNIEGNAKIETHPGIAETKCALF